MLFHPCWPVLTLAPSRQLVLPMALAMMLLSWEERVPANSDWTMTADWLWLVAARVVL